MGRERHSNWVESESGVAIMHGSVRFEYQGYTVTCRAVGLPTGRYAPRATIAPPGGSASAVTRWASDDTTFATAEAATEFASDAVKQLIDHLGETDWTPLP
jgi:hypothetical protein